MGEKGDPSLAKMIFRLAADKEANHVRWVKMLIEIAKAKKLAKETGVGISDLEFWIDDEGVEGESTRSSPMQRRSHGQRTC